MKKRRKTGGEDWQERLERFLSSPLAMRASEGLCDRISVALHVDGAEDFFFRRKKGVNTVERVETLRPDVHFWIRLATLQHLLSVAEAEDAGIGEIGVAIFEHIFTKNESDKIRFRVDTGFLGLWSKGYFSVLKAGGPEVASYLARLGFSGLSAIKEVLRKIKA